MHIEINADEAFKVIESTEDTELLKSIVVQLANHKGIAFKVREAAKAKLVKCETKKSRMPAGFSFGIVALWIGIGVVSATAILTQTEFGAWVALLLM